MRLSDAFRETIFRFRLKAADLAESSGLSPSQVSSFQRGGNLRSDSIDRLFQALEELNPEAKVYMFSLLAAPESGANLGDPQLLVRGS